MAKQRFIHPDIWDDKTLGLLPEAELLLYIACFSLADDEGRLVGEAAWLRAHVFPYREYTSGEVAMMRDHIAAEKRNFHVYTDDGKEYIAFLNWDEFQKPKYKRDSKLPAPVFPAPGAFSQTGPVLAQTGANLDKNGDGPEKSRSTGRVGLDSDRDGQGRSADRAEKAPLSISRDFPLPASVVRDIEAA